MTRLRWMPIEGFNGYLVAIDTRGRMDGPLRLRTEHARKELLAICGRQHADKIMIDGPDGACHVGYVIGQHWFMIMRVIQTERV